MLRLFRSQWLSRWSTPLLVAMLASNVAGPAPTEAGEVRQRSIVALATPADVTTSFLNLFAATDAEPGAARPRSGMRDMVRRALGVPTADGAARKWSDASLDKPAEDFRQIVIAQVDPHFERWQKDANERLKEEKALRTVKPHPLAEAHPDKAVVVCEAGCRTPKDEVVYIAAIVPAVEPPRTYESTSSQPATVDEGNLPCIAGCYEKPERNKPSPRRNADVSPPKQRREVSPVTVTGAIAGANQRCGCFQVD
jgi:hypothetical protein